MALWPRVATIVAGVLGLCAYALAHDAHHPENNQWMKTLASQVGPCCDGSDAVRVDDPDWAMAENGHMQLADGSKVECEKSGLNGPMGQPEGHYCVRLKVHPDDQQNQETKWFMVPVTAEVTSDNSKTANGAVQSRDGVVRVWPVIMSQFGAKAEVIGIRCFLAGASG